MAAVEDDLRDGDKYFEDGDWKKAAAAYDRAISKAPGQVSAEAYGKRAAIFIILKDFKGGLAFVETSKRTHANAPELMEQEAIMLWQSGNREEAIRVAEKVVKARPQSFANQSLVGEYYALRDPVKTASAYEAYLQYRPSEFEGGDVLPRIRLGFAYLSNARSVLGDGDEARAQVLYKKAAEQFETVQRKHAKKPHAAINADNGLCAAYVGLNRWDQAISVCERATASPARIDATGSAYYNLTRAYLARKQLQKARENGNQFIRVRKGEARGFMLVGDTYFEERNYTAALDQYRRAEGTLKPNQSREQGQLAIRLGKTYRRIPVSGSAGTNQNLNLAIEKLSGALSANPNNIEVAVELGGAYLEARQDAKAAALSDRLIAGPEFAKIRPDQQAAVLMISGKALFRQKGKLKEARQRFEAARQLRGADITVQRALITTINEQAYIEVSQKDYPAAQAFLEEAAKIDPGAPVTLRNLAVLQLERGNCNAATTQLTKLAGVRGSNPVLTNRLLARSYLCGNTPNTKKAAAAFAQAEAEAKKSNAEQLALAEIYTEWAPLIWSADINGAVEKLELAVRASAQDPDIGPAAKRNYALALYRRGWNYMRQGKPIDAAADFENAIRDPGVLKGTEPLAFEFSLALAQLDSRPADAAKIFKNLEKKGNQGAYLKGAYAQIGGQFFSAYAAFKSSQGAQREQACGQLSAVQGQLGGRAKEIVASCWEYVAYDHWRAGAWGAAQKAISNAAKSASASQKPRLDNNTMAMGLSQANRGALEALNGTPAEALVNLGIVYDMMGRPKDAFDTWSKAKARGATARDLQKWIDAKKRIYGY